MYTYDAVGNRLSWANNTTLGYFWSNDSANMPSAMLSNMTSLGYGNTANPNQNISLTRSYNLLRMLALKYEKLGKKTTLHVVVNFRVLYDVDDQQKIVWIYALRKRNERTYR